LGGPGRSSEKNQRGNIFENVWDVEQKEKRGCVGTANVLVRYPGENKTAGGARKGGWDQGSKGPLKEKHEKKIK